MFSKFAKLEPNFSPMSNVTSIENATLISILNDRIKSLEAQLLQKTSSTPSAHLTNLKEEPTLESKILSNAEFRTQTHNSKNIKLDTIEPAMQANISNRNLKPGDNINSSEEYKDTQPEIFVIPDDIYRNIVMKNPTKFIEHLSTSGYLPSTDPNSTINSENSTIPIKETTETVSNKNISSPKLKLPNYSKETLNKTLTETIGTDLASIQDHHEFNFILPEQIKQTSSTILSSYAFTNRHAIPLYFTEKLYHQQMITDPIFGQLYQKPIGNYHKENGILYFNTNDTTYLGPIEVIPCSMLVLLIEARHFVEGEHIPSMELDRELPDEFRFDDNYFEAALRIVHSNCQECQKLKLSTANSSSDKIDDDTNFLKPEDITQISSDFIFRSEYEIPHYFTIQLYQQEIQKDPTFGKTYMNPSKNFLRIKELLFKIEDGYRYLVIPDTMLYLLIRAKHFDEQGNHTSSLEMSGSKRIDYKVTGEYHLACDILLSNCSLCQSEYNQIYQDWSEDTDEDSDTENSISEPSISHTNETSHCDQQNSDNESISEFIDLEELKDIDILHENLIKPISAHMQMNEIEFAAFYRNQMKRDPYFSKIYHNPPENFYIESSYLTYNDINTQKIVIPDKIIGILLQIHHSNEENLHISTENLPSLFEHLYWFNRFDFQKHLNDIESMCSKCRKHKSETPSDENKSEGTSIITDRTPVEMCLEESITLYKNQSMATKLSEKDLELAQQNVEGLQPEVRTDQLSPHVIHKQNDTVKTQTNGNSDHLITSTDTSQINNRSKQTIYIIPARKQFTQDSLPKQTTVLRQIDERFSDNSDYSRSQKQTRFNNFQKNQQNFNLQNKPILDLIDKRNQFKPNRTKVKLDQTERYSTFGAKPIRQILRTHAKKMPEVFYYRKRSTPEVQQCIFDEMRYAIKLIAEKNLKQTCRTKPPTSLYKTDQTNSPNHTTIIDNSNSSINESSNIQANCETKAETQTNRTQDLSDSNSEITTIVKTNLLNDDTNINNNTLCTNNNGLENTETIAMHTKCEPTVTRHQNLNDETVVNNSNNQILSDVTSLHTQPDSNIQLLQTDIAPNEVTKTTNTDPTMEISATPEIVSLATSCENLSISDDSGFGSEDNYQCEIITSTNLTHQESYAIVDGLIFNLISTLSTNGKSKSLDNQSSEKPLKENLQKLRRLRSNSI